MIFQNFPLENILDIFEYLEPSQVSQLKLVSKHMHQLLKTTDLEFSVYKKYYNLCALPDFEEEATQKLLPTILAQLSKETKKDLPFWGHSTTGGIYQNSLRFWIGKSFMKSIEPIVWLKAVKDAKIVGKLAHNYNSFKNSLMKCFKIIHYSQSGFEIDITPDIFSVFTTFMMIYNFDQEMYQDQLAPEVMQEYHQAKSRLMSYTQITSHFISNQHNQMNVQIGYQQFDSLANIHQIQISRNPQMENCVQQLILITKDTNITNAKLQHWLFSNNRQNWFKYLGVSNFDHSNIQTLVNLPKTMGLRYILFKPNQQGLLFWVDFGDKGYEKVHLPCEFRPWTDTVYIHLIKGKNELQNVYGMNIEYCSLEGVMINKYF